MGKKNKKKGEFTSRDQEKLQARWDEFFLSGGTSGFPFGGNNDEEENDNANDDFARAIESMFGFNSTGDAVLCSDEGDETESNNEKDEEEEERENEREDEDVNTSSSDVNIKENLYMKYNESHTTDSFNDQTQINTDIETDDTDTEDSPVLPSLFYNEDDEDEDEDDKEEDENPIGTIDVLMNNFGTLIFKDRERGIYIDTRELSVNNDSQFVTSEQLDDTFKFFIINSRPDAIFTIDEFIEKIYKNYESVDDDNFIFVKDNKNIFVYYIGQEVYEAWEIVCDHLKASDRLYDFCNTLAKKCSGKHYRMNHSRAYINFWLDTYINVEGADNEYILDVLRSDGFGGDEWEDGPKFDKNGDMLPGHYKFIDYWEFYSSFKTKYYAKSSFDGNVTQKVTNVKTDTSTVKVDASETAQDKSSSRDVYVLEVGTSEKIETTEDSNTQGEIFNIQESDEPVLDEEDNGDPDVSISMDYDPTPERLGNFAVHRRQ